MTKMKCLMVVVGTILLAGPAPTQPTPLDFTKPAVFVSVLQKAGYRAELKKRDDGAPYVASAANGNDFYIHFYECDAPKLACKSFDLYSWWKKAPYFTVALANKWNADKRFMKVAIDAEGDLEQRVYGTGVGLTEAGFLELIDWYESMDAELDTFLKEEKPAEPAVKK